MDLVAGALKEYFNAAPVAHVYRKPVSERRDVMPPLGAFCTTGLFAGLIEYAGSIANDGGRGNPEGGSDGGVSAGIQTILDAYPVGTSVNPKTQEIADIWDAELKENWSGGGTQWLIKIKTSDCNSTFQDCKVIIQAMKRAHSTPSEVKNTLTNSISLNLSTIAENDNEIKLLMYAAVHDEIGI
jgi:hypothetical protein